MKISCRLYKGVLLLLVMEGALGESLLVKLYTDRVVLLIWCQGIGTFLGDLQSKLKAWGCDCVCNLFPFVSIAINIEYQGNFFAFIAHLEQKSIMLDEDQVFIAVCYRETIIFEELFNEAKRPIGD